jgi:hypothetical protein
VIAGRDDDDGVELRRPEAADLGDPAAEILEAPRLPRGFVFASYARRASS